MTKVIIRSTLGAEVTCIFSPERGENMKALVVIPNIHGGRSDRAASTVSALQEMGFSARWLAPEGVVECAGKESCSVLVLIGFEDEVAVELASECAKALECHVIAERDGNMGFVRLNGATHACSETIQAILSQFQE